MTAVVAGKLRFLFLPFLLSLFGKGGMAKMLGLVTSILAVLLSVSDYGVVLPWVTGMLISGVLVWERIRSRRHAGNCTTHKKRRGGIAPAAPQLFARWSRAESAPMPGRKLRA